MHVLLNDGNSQMIVRATPENSHQAHIGETVSIGFNHDKLLVFAADGVRLSTTGDGQEARIA